MDSSQKPQTVEYASTPNAGPDFSKKLWSLDDNDDQEENPQVTPVGWVPCKGMGDSYDLLLEKHFQYSRHPNPEQNCYTFKITRCPEWYRILFTEKDAQQLHYDPTGRHQFKLQLKAVPHPDREDHDKRQALGAKLYDKIVEKRVEISNRDIKTLIRHILDCVLTDSFFRVR